MTRVEHICTLVAIRERPMHLAEPGERGIMLQLPLSVVRPRLITSGYCMRVFDFQINKAMSRNRLSGTIGHCLCSVTQVEKCQ